MLGRYRNPDELPKEGYGFEPYDNEEEEEEEEDEYRSKKVKSDNIPSSTGEFHFVFHEVDYDLPNFALLYGKMINTATGEIVGVLSGDLLQLRFLLAQLGLHDR